MSHLFSASRMISFGLVFVLLAGVVQMACGDDRAIREHMYREHEFREHDFREHQFLDARYHHDHYYPPRGYVFGGLPRGYSVVFHGGIQFYFSGGIWYRSDGHSRFVVVAPPIGVGIQVLPPFYSTVWVGSVPNYYANDVYYVRSPQGYVVVDPPPGNVVMEQPPNNAVIEPPPATVAQAPPEQVFIYPRQGQGEQQQATDRYECHRWAVSQTAFDPTLSPAGVATPQQAQKHADYQRALNACLDGRGYTVR
jgi:hypothetical protein